MRVITRPPAGGGGCAKSRGSEILERAKGFEPSTPTLARLCSTPELRPRSTSHAGPVASVKGAEITAFPGLGKTVADPG